MASQNHVLGKGKLYFAEFAANTETPGGRRYLGNTPEFSMTVESEQLDHMNSDEGIKEVDESVTLSTTRSLSFVTDHISPQNVADFLLGSASTLAQSSATDDTETLTGVLQGMYYQLGISATNPAGVRQLSNVVVTGPSGTPTHVAGDDYTVDLETGMIYIVPGGAITDASTIELTYDLAAVSRDRIISGNDAKVGELFFESKNPVGEKRDFLFPKVRIYPNGDYALKGDEWQQIGFQAKVLKRGALEAIYCDGRPYTP